MAQDESLLAMVRKALAGEQVEEVSMFGGVAFMLQGNMLVAASDRGLMLRVGEQGLPAALAGGASVVEMGGRTMRGYVRVSTALKLSEVKSWLSLARAFVQTLPPKKRKAAVARKRKKA